MRQFYHTVTLRTPPSPYFSTVRQKEVYEPILSHNIQLSSNLSQIDASYSLKRRGLIPYFFTL